MKCYYEVLGVERDAEEKEIKTSYRKLALRWHPDKNMDRLDEAKEQFQLLQQAYEVLSDPQERAWYDKHRDEILRGKDSNYEDSCLDVFAYFTSSCFKGYGDDAKGFFAVYRDVFEQIATEDIEFYEDPDEVEAIPKFGDSKSSYDEVVGPFYAHWQAYCTKKSYAWLCPFNVKEYRDRRILREIEKETKKIVQKAKRERNEEVRNLVSFIRKRDPRVKAYKQQLEERAAENRKKQEQNRLEQYKRRQQEVEEMKKTHQNVVPEGYEEQLRKLAQDYGGSEEDEFTDDEEGDGEGESDDEAGEAELEADDLEYVDDLYCVACNKSFKNQNAFANHESSKKHKENVERMRSEMEEEEEMYLNSNGKADSDLEEVIEDDDEADLDDLAHRIDEDLVLDEDDIQDLSEASDGGVPLPMQQSKSSKKSKKKKRKQAVEVIPDDDNEEVEAEPVEEVVPEPDDSAVEARKGSKKSKKAKRKQAAKAASDEELPQEPPTEPSGSFEEEPAKAKKKGGKQKSKAKSHQQAGDSSGSAGESDEDDEEGAAKKPSANPSLITTNTSLGCAKCGATFPSKNKLFAHLKLTQHSIYLPKPPVADEPKGKKAKDKKKKK